MANIYNKTFHHPNGTLISNWFEEEELRNKTGFGSRTITKVNFPKKNLDLNNPNPPINPNPSDDTFTRLIADKKDVEYNTFYSAYGNFKHPEEKYMHQCFRQAEFNNFIDQTIQSNTNAEGSQETRRKNIRLFQTTKGDYHVAQPDMNIIGKRHMFTPEHVPIPEEQPDKLFMATHGMNKFQRAITNKQIDEYIDKSIPYTKDKEITFWSTNLNKGNMYHTHSLGINPFGKSNSFTQDIHHTKGATQYEGNNHNSINSKNIFFNQHDIDQYNNFQQNLPKEKEITDLLPQISAKVLFFCQSRGWLGMRKFKIYLRNLFKRKSNMIDKTEFKFNLSQYGWVVLDEELNFIYLKYDQMKCNKINFIEFFDSLHKMSEERMKIVMSLLNETNQSDQKFISLRRLLRMANFNYHPEVIQYFITSNDAMREYSNTWDNLKEDDFITKENFVKYFEDISCSILKDEDFKQCLIALGLKQ